MTTNFLSLLNYFFPRNSYKRAQACMWIIKNCVDEHYFQEQLIKHPCLY